MKLVRLISLPKSQAVKIRRRQKEGTMTEVFDKEQYLCFIQKEYDEWKPRKVGRKPNKTTIKG